MIEEIKQALEEANLVRGVAGVPSAEKDEWIRYLLGEVEQLEKEKSNVHDWREKAAREASQLRGQVEELQMIIETAVMFLQSNELHVKAEQIKAMVKKGRNHEIR